MAGWLDRLGATLIDASLATTAITGLVLLAILQCRQPARRRSWARTGLISSLAVVPLAALNPFPRFDIHSPFRSLFFDTPAGPSCWGEAGIRIERAIHPGSLGADRGGPRDRSASDFPKIGRVVVVGYLLGLTTGVAWLALGFWGAILRIRRASGPSPASIRLYDSILPETKAARPRLLVSHETTRPMLVGSFRPVILIPPDLDQANSRERLRLSLLHELAHVENMDHRFMPIAHLAEAVWFFLPTFWWIRDQLKLDQEFLADRRAVTEFGTSSDYASSLVDLAAAPVIHGESCSNFAIIQPPIAVPVVASALVQRVQMLLKCPFPIERTTPLWWRWSTTLTLILATTAASCLTMRSLVNSQDPGHLFTERITEPFRLDHLVIAQRLDLEPFDLRYRLPPQFILTLELMAMPGEPTLIEILGHRIGPLEHPSSGPGVEEKWHRIQIRRMQGFDFVEVNGSPVARDSVSLPKTTWLTLRPLNSRPTRIRDLRVD